MLTVAGQDRWLYSRPLPLVDVDDVGEMWFIIDRLGRLCDDLIAMPRVAVMSSANGDGSCIAVSGRAIIIDNPSMLRELWREEYRCWFARGVGDSRLVVLCVAVRDAYLWTGVGFPIQGDGA